VADPKVGPPYEAADSNKGPTRETPDRDFPDRDEIHPGRAEFETIVIDYIYREDTRRTPEIKEPHTAENQSSSASPKQTEQEFILAIGWGAGAIAGVSASAQTSLYLSINLNPLSTKPMVRLGLSRTTAIGAKTALSAPSQGLVVTSGYGDLDEGYFGRLEAATVLGGPAELAIAKTDTYSSAGLDLGAAGVGIGFGYEVSDTVRVRELNTQDVSSAADSALRELNNFLWRATGY
jgi:hypothetical protein